MKRTQKRRPIRRIILVSVRFTRDEWRHVARAIRADETCSEAMRRLLLAAIPPTVAPYPPLPEWQP